MKAGEANEADVREEIAAPFLAELGYQRGTSNDIARELPLSYPRQFLGRKKPVDPPLRGRADYVMTVKGAGRWVLETKAPSEPIDIEAIEQTISYARHPEVSASYCVVLNGVRLTVHHTSQSSTEAPLFDLPVSDAKSLAHQLSGLLSPSAIRRDCSPRTVELGKPLADGLRARQEIFVGEMTHEQCRWESNTPLPSESASYLNEMCRRLAGLRIAVTGGSIWRDEQSRIRARFQWSMPHDELVRFALNKKLMDAEFVALSETISACPENPTVLEVCGDVEVTQGETLFNMLEWETQIAGLAMKMSYAGQATGYIAENTFQGVFSAQYYCDFPETGRLKMFIETTGSFRVQIDNR